MGLFLHTANNRLEDDILITPYIKPLAAMMCGVDRGSFGQGITTHSTEKCLIHHPEHPQQYPVFSTDFSVVDG